MYSDGDVAAYSLSRRSQHYEHASYPVFRKS